MIFFVFLSFAVLRGFYAIIMKLSQKGYISSVNDSFYFLVITSSFQVIFLFILPPYYLYSYEVKMVVYPLFFSICYFLSFSFLLNSLRFGSTSLASVIKNFSIFIPIIAGLIFWNENISLYQIAGVSLFITAVFLFNRGTYRVGDTDNEITLKWTLLVLASTFFGGTAGTISKQYALVYDNNPKEYLIAFNVIIMVFGIIYFSFLKKRKKYKPFHSKKLIGYAALAGLVQVLNNILYMLYVAKFDSAFFFPMLSTSSIVSVIILSRLFLKEKGTRKTYVGILFCITAIFLLNMG